MKTYFALLLACSSFINALRTEKPQGFHTEKGLSSAGTYGCVADNTGRSVVAEKKKNHRGGGRQPRSPNCPLANHYQSATHTHTPAETSSVKPSFFPTSDSHRRHRIEREEGLAPTPACNLLGSSAWCDTTHAFGRWSLHRMINQTVTKSSEKKHNNVEAQEGEPGRPGIRSGRLVCKTRRSSGG